MWLELPRDVRDHLMKVFGVVKTGVAEVRDQTVISDGVTNDDLSVISFEKMTEYVGPAEDFHKLWQITVSKANYELHPPIDILDLADLGFKEVSNEEFTQIQTQAQTAELNAMTPTLEVKDINGDVILSVPNDQIVTITPRYCDTCDSTKGRHRKGCPKFK